jgi:hypothetical protein
MLNVKEEVPGLHESFKGTKKHGVWVIKERKRQWPKLFLPESQLPDIPETVIPDPSRYI